MKFNSLLLALIAVSNSYVQNDQQVLNENEILTQQAQLKYFYINGWTEDMVLNIKPPGRPNPEEYINSDYIANHLKNFRYGGSKILPTAWLDKHGRDLVGDENGQFIIPKKQMDELLQKANGDLTYVEQNLGIPSGKWKNRRLSRIDFMFPEQYNVRMPTGNERSVNEYWKPGGVLANGLLEAVIDQVPKAGYQEFPLNLQ